jgi:hypothetical protein
MISIKKLAYSVSVFALVGGLVACGGGTDTADTGAEDTAADAAKMPGLRWPAP